MAVEDYSGRQSPSVHTLKVADFSQGQRWLLAWAVLWRFWVAYIVIAVIVFLLISLAGQHVTTPALPSSS